MKFAAALLSLVGYAAAAKQLGKPIAIDNIAADSNLGMNLLSKARRLDGGNQYYGNGQYANSNGYDMYGNNAWADNNAQGFQNWFMSMHTWVKDYAIKFQGCHHISEWNEDAADQADVRIRTRRLVKFSAWTPPRKDVNRDTVTTSSTWTLS